MTLSKAEWQSKRPEKLKGMDAGKLMEALKRKPGDSIEEWKECLENCDKLKDVLDKTPRVLTSHMTDEFRRALDVWYTDIENLQKGGKKALALLGEEHVDDLCTEHGKAVERDTTNLIKTVKAAIKTEKKREGGEKDMRGFERLRGELVRTCEAIREMRKEKMTAIVSRDRMAQQVIKDRLVNMGSFRMTCDPMLKGLLDEVANVQEEYEELMEAS